MHPGSFTRGKKNLTEEDLDIAKLCRFYGCLPNDVRSMDVEDVSMLWQAITPLEARELLIGMKLSEYPWMKDEKDSFHTKTVDAAYPFSEKRSMSWDDLAKSTGQTRSHL